MPLGQLDTYIGRLRWLLLGAIVVVALLGIGVSSLLTSYVARQFSHAQQLAATVADGNYHLRIPEAGPRELRDLSHYLNLMAEKLQFQTEARQTLLANVAHELARPLGGLQLGIESLRKGALQDPGLADEMLLGMGQTIQRLTALIDDIALAAQPQAKPIELHQTAVAVEPFLQGMAARYWTRAEARGIRLKLDVEAGLRPFYADEKRLYQIIGNLLDNAIKFTPRGQAVYLSAACTDHGHICVRVRDSGTGIAAEDAKHLFEPFYQGDSGRRVQRGMGLGLSIALQLARAHGGTLELQNDRNGGAVAILMVPEAGA
jgi:two-component system sensor histidine kinase VicK